MARILTIFSILIGLATAFLGWKTREQALELQSNLRDAKSGRTAAEGKQKSAEKERDESVIERTPVEPNVGHVLRPSRA